MSTYSDRVDDLVERIDDRNPLWIIEEVVERLNLSDDAVAWMRLKIREEADRAGKAGNLRKACEFDSQARYLNGLLIRARRAGRGETLDYGHLDATYRSLVSRVKSGSLTKAQLRKTIKQKLAAA